jgi:hypothetical protein
MKISLENVYYIRRLLTAGSRRADKINPVLSLANSRCYVYMPLGI